jgi:hypothetical protein
LNCPDSRETKGISANTIVNNKPVILELAVTPETEKSVAATIRSFGGFVMIFDVSQNIKI